MKNLVCIVCPNGCALEVSKDRDGITVSGNKCPKGAEFTRSEETYPMRTIASTVRTVFSEVPVLPVRVSAEIPKSRIYDVMGEINKAVVTEKIDSGAVIIPNVLGLGVDVIATSNILRQKAE